MKIGDYLKLGERIESIEESFRLIVLLAEKANDVTEDTDKEAIKASIMGFVKVLKAELKTAIGITDNILEDEHK